MKIETVRNKTDSEFKKDVNNFLDKNYKIQQCGAIAASNYNSLEFEWWAILTLEEFKDLPPGDSD